MAEQIEYPPIPEGHHAHFDFHAFGLNRVQAEALVDMINAALEYRGKLATASYVIEADEPPEVEELDAEVQEAQRIHEEIHNHPVMKKLKKAHDGKKAPKAS